MSRSTLKFLAILLSVLIVAVLLSGFDDLPREVRAQISNERTALATAQSQLHSEKDEVARDVQAEPALFGAVPESAQWPATFAKDEGVLADASRDMDELTRLQKANRRQDRQRAEALLAHERSLRTSAIDDTGNVRKEAAHWVEWKQHLPQAVQQMEQDFRAVHGVNLAPVAKAVQKAEADWPQKKSDLDSRLATVRELQVQSESAWQDSAEARLAAATRRLRACEPASPGGRGGHTAHRCDRCSQESGRAEGALSGQLYNNWDKMLVDMETRGIGSDKSYDQKIRTVTTHVPDAAAKNGETASDEKWVEVPKSTFDAQKNDLGMVLEHKPAGLYDYEAEHTPQPAGFAYMAPPSVGSNQYGYWDHHGDGTSFWVFYGQYALMRDLLFNHSYRPPMPYEYDGYYTAAPQWPDLLRQGVWHRRARQRRSATRAARTPRAGASAIRNSPARAEAIAIPGLLRPMRATPMPTTAREPFGSASAGAARQPAVAVVSSAPSRPSMPRSAPPEALDAAGNAGPVGLLGRGTRRAARAIAGPDAASKSMASPPESLGH